MNVYCMICKKEMEIIEDYKTVVKVHPCGCANTDLARITAERDAAISDLQDAVNHVYNMYGESNETLAAITTAHWRAVIADVKKNSV